MKRKNRILDSLYTKLFLTFFGLFMPIYIIYLLLFSWGKDMLTQEILNNSSSNISFIQQRLDTQFEILDKQVVSMTLNNSKLLQKVFIANESPKSAEYYFTVFDLISILRVTERSNDMIKELIIYYPEYGISISSLHSISEIDWEALYALLFTFRQQKNFFVEYNGDFYIGHDFPLSGSYMYSEPFMYPHAFICAVLSVDTVQKYLSVYANDNMRPTFFVHNSTGYYISDVYTQAHSNGSLIQQVFNNNVKNNDWLYVSSESGYGDYTFYQFISKKQLLAVPQRFQLFLLLSPLIFLPIFLLYFMCIRRYIRYPINELLSTFSRIDDESIGIQIPPQNTSEEFRLLIEGFNHMSSRLRDLIEKVYKQEMYAQKIEFRQLQAQINPHFLYNSFYTLRHLIEDEDIETATSMADYMGDYFRYITKTDISEIHFPEEYRNAAAYLQIQKLRFEKQLVVNMDEPTEKLQDVIIPKLILQPIVENAFIHGINSQCGVGIINVHLHISDTSLSVIVEDNGTSLDDASLSLIQAQLDHRAPMPQDTTALFNIHKRLQLAFGKEYGLRLSRSELGGLSVELSIPLYC